MIRRLVPNSFLMLLGKNIPEAQEAVMQKLNGIISPKVTFFLASYSLCLDNVVKCETMLPYLKIYKRMFTIDCHLFLLLFVKLCKAFGLGILFYHIILSNNRLSFKK